MTDSSPSPASSSRPDPFKERLHDCAGRIEETLHALLSGEGEDGNQKSPESLLAAMRHGALNGGKRIRPFLMIETARMLGYEAPGVLQAACALECVHCYSLIHDDLPAMDDDDLRRGKPTVHVEFGEAMAILAGDGLLTLAFEVLAEESIHPDASVRAELVLGLARNAGLKGMVGGQVLDIEAEHRTKTEEEILRLQAMKTGALLRYACEAGATLACASTEDRARVTRFGTIIGLAFQLADDLLDVTATSEQLGKTAGKDLKSEKATLVSLYGIEATRQKLNDLIEEAETLLKLFGDKADILISTAHYIAKRTH
ncbi:polyprenyl synthetase family protein [uncultured Cohaesibacter sp.]|uniref:polyprenyl synthetase family protein n=1 Tax=uncultured Cohaesibacter sp. TaxID=1002546 RepID=UPI003747CFB0